MLGRKSEHSPLSGVENSTSTVWLVRPVDASTISKVPFLHRAAMCWPSGAYATAAALIGVKTSRSTVPVTDSKMMTLSLMVTEPAAARCSLFGEYARDVI